MANITQNTIINEQVYVYPNADALYRKDIRTIGKREIKRDNITLAEAIPIALALGCFLIVAYEGTYILKGKGEDYEKVKANLGKSTRKPTSAPVISYLIKQEVIDAYNRKETDNRAQHEETDNDNINISISDIAIIDNISDTASDISSICVTGEDLNSHGVQEMVELINQDYAKMEKIISENDEKDAVIADLRLAITTLSDENKQLTQECAGLSEANKVLSEANKVLSEANKVLSEANNKLSEANKVLRQENKQLKVCAEECAAFKGEFYKKSREVEELTAALSAEKQRADSYKKMVHDLTKY
jgi:DNA repair exonuclease SbcCD ATPase subunit